MPATPRRARNFGGSSQHQRLMMANLAASLFAATVVMGAVGAVFSFRRIIRIDPASALGGEE